jgi:hypothetical protein
MTADNTLLGRCTVALKEALATSAPLSQEQAAAARRGTAAVLEHLSYELISLSERRPSMTVHSLALLLRQEAQL